MLVSQGYNIPPLVTVERGKPFLVQEQISYGTHMRQYEGSSLR
ncbi:MAG: hypothetical protein ACD_41C00220G0002 [uncultured bacterium]|nr:MAG: hypothetical protein ACD_41C00220G0002 [uncultured bacterium]